MREDFRVVRTPWTSITMEEAVQVFGGDVFPVVGGTRSWGATIKKITGVTPTREQIKKLCSDSSKGTPLGKVNRYFMYPKDSLIAAAHRSVL